MRVQWQLRSRLVLALAMAVIAVIVGTAEQVGTAQPEGGQAPAAPAQGRGAGRGNFANNFTGTVAVQQTTGMNMSRIRFEAAARTNWHLHSAAQILLIEEGRGRWQEQGDVVKDLPANQPVITKPNVLHWHGAAPDQAAVQFSVYAGTLEWKQAVTNEEYLGRK
jgi:quercetin dioxygenase-like cupin family protein